jgi:hypothetical protein
MALAVCLEMLAVLSFGCGPAKPAAPVLDPASSSPAARQLAEAQSVAEAALGKQAEILDHGDLAQNGTEQVLAVNRVANARQEAGSKGMVIRRAAILEKNGGKWSEVLRCDEHLKNTHGYLTGAPTAQVSGWRLEYNLDSGQGLELKFTPANAIADAPGTEDSSAKTLFVRWNKSAKRYQSLDQSHEKFLNEVPNLETPMSILK